MRSRRGKRASSTPSASFFSSASRESFSSPGSALTASRVPLLQVPGIADPGGTLGVEPGCQRFLVDQQVGTADLVLQPLDIGDDLAVVADEVGIDGPFAG